MKNNKIPLFIVLTCLTVSACTTPKYTKRYKSLENTTTTKPNEFVSATAFCFDVDKLSTSKGLYELSERGQKELIAQVSSKEKDGSGLYNQLSKKFVEPARQNSSIRNTEFKKRIVISVEDLKNQNGANRIDWIRIKLNIQDTANVKFYYWDKIVTEYQEIDLGKLTFERSNSFSSSPDFTMSGTVKGNAPLSYSTSGKVNEEISFKTKFAKLSGSLNESTISIYRKSAPMEDITGNIVIEVSIKAKKNGETSFSEFDGLTEKDVIVTDPSKVKLKTINYQSANFHATETNFGLSYQFGYREVFNGAKTFTEADDSIRIVQGEIKSPEKFPLLQEEDLTQRIWNVSAPDDELLSLKKGSTQSTINFDSYDKAKAFLEWLRQTSNLTVAGYDLYLGLSTLKKEDIPSLSAKTFE